MKFNIETQGASTYLVYTIDKKDDLDSLSLGMIINNKIKGIAQVIFTQQDTDKFLKYNITAKVSVKQFFLGQVNRKRLIGVFSCVIEALLAAEEFMIDSDSFILDTEYMFADVTTCDALLICLPIINKDQEENDVRMFFKNILFSLQFDSTENCDYVTKLFNYLNGASVFSLMELKKIIDELKNEKIGIVQKVSPQIIKEPAKIPDSTISVNHAPQIQTPVKQIQQQTAPNIVPQVVTSNNQQPKGFSLFGSKKKEKKEKPIKPSKPSKPAKQKQPPIQIPGGFAVQGAPKQPVAINIPIAPISPTATNNNINQNAQYTAQQQQVSSPPAFIQQNTANYGETTVLSNGNIGETTVLSQANVSLNSPYLIRLKNNEKININKPVFRIGKEKSYVDYFIGDNSSISRSHSNIISRDGEYFIVDTNSTNHTYVNSIMLQGNSEVKIAHGSKICLANEEFEFKLY